MTLDLDRIGIDVERDGDAITFTLEPGTAQVEITPRAPQGRGAGQGRWPL